MDVKPKEGKDRKRPKPGKGGPRRSANKGRSNSSEDDNDDGSDIETMSRMSCDDGSVMGESVLGDVALGENNDAALIIEEKFKENIDKATEKNSRSRTDALKNLVALISRRYLPDLLENWKATLIDCIERTVKKGVPPDTCFAIRLASLLSIQLGEDSIESVRKLLSTLCPQVANQATNTDYRTECCYALGVCSFMAEPELENKEASMQCVEDVWSQCKIGCTVEAVPLFCASLSAWSFILLDLPSSKMRQRITSQLPKLVTLLDSSHLEMRVAIGETIALLYELGNEMSTNVEFRPSIHQHLLDKLEGLATDSVKYRAKKDRKTQRASFRDVLSAVNDGSMPDLTVKFGSETLILDCWAAKVCYDNLCHVLGSGMPVHLKENFLVRSTFNLGNPVEDQGNGKMTKFERELMKNTISKARTLVRAKQRDKRMATYS